MGTSLLTSHTCAHARDVQGTVRLNEAEHRHRNTLQIMRNLIRRSLREAEGAEARELLASIDELIDTMMQLHTLCQDRDDDLAVLLPGMVRHWQRLCNGHIRLSVDVEDGLQMAQSSRTAAVLIAQELILNAVKHAFPDKKRGTIRIRLYCNGGKDVTLDVEDDGVGALASGATRRDGASQGHGLVRDLSQALGGTVRHGAASNGAGHRVTVCWPLIRKTA